MPRVSRATRASAMSERGGACVERRERVTMMYDRPQAGDVSVPCMCASLPRPAGTRLDHAGKFCLVPTSF